MSRVTYAVPSRKRRKMVLQRAKGFYGNASRNIRTAMMLSIKLCPTATSDASRKSSSIVSFGSSVSTPPAVRWTSTTAPS